MQAPDQWEMLPGDARFPGFRYKGVLRLDQKLPEVKLKKYSLAVDLVKSASWFPALCEDNRNTVQNTMNRFVSPSRFHDRPGCWMPLSGSVPLSAPLSGSATPLSGLPMPPAPPNESTMDFFLALPTTSNGALQLAPDQFLSLSSRNGGVPFIPLFKDCVQAGVAPVMLSYSCMAELCIAHGAACVCRVPLPGDANQPLAHCH